MKKILYLILFLLSFSCVSDEMKEIKEIKHKYDKVVYPEEIEFSGIIKSISLVKVKRMGDMFFSQSNEVVIDADTTTFHINFDNISFNIGDSVIVKVGKRSDSYPYRSKIIIISSNGESESFWILVNEKYKNIVKEKINDVKSKGNSD